MAISDVQEYMHLTDEEIEQLGRELDALRKEIEESRGDADAAYINRMIRIQRGLAVAGRLTLLLGTQSRKTRVPAAVAGATLPLLVALIDKSLLRHTPTGRYEMHELLRQYAEAQLDLDLAAQLEASVPRYSATLRLDHLKMAHVLAGESGTLRALVQIQGTGFAASQRRAEVELRLETDFTWS